MQNAETLINLGFERYPEWDYDDPGTKHYRKEMNGKVFRAYEFTCNGPVYVIMGEVSTSDGKVKRWMDCCSDGSVDRKLEIYGENYDEDDIEIEENDEIDPVYCIPFNCEAHPDHPDHWKWLGWEAERKRKTKTIHT